MGKKEGKKNEDNINEEKEQKLKEEIESTLKELIKSGVDPDKIHIINADDISLSKLKLKSKEMEYLYSLYDTYNALSSKIENIDNTYKNIHYMRMVQNVEPNFQRDAKEMQQLSIMVGKIASEMESINDFLVEKKVLGLMKSLDENKYFTDKDLKEYKKNVKIVEKAFKKRPAQK
jgi:hypothetical protein